MSESFSEHHVTRAPARRRRARSVSVWRRLTEPAAAIQETYRRSQARLLATLLIVCIALAVIMEAVTIALTPASEGYTGYQQTIFAEVFLLMAYALSRTERFERGAVVSVAVATAAVFAGAIAEASNISVSFLDYLIVPLLLGSLFLSARVLFWLSILDVAGLLLVPLANPSVRVDLVLMGPMMFVVSTAGLFLIAVRQRDALERERQAELAEKEERYRRLVEQLPAITYMAEVDPARPGTWTLRYVSPQFEALLGYAVEDIWANPELQFQIIHPDDRDGVFDESMRQIMNHGSSSQEYRLVARDGRVLSVRDQTVIRQDATNERFLIQGLLFDITERKRAEDEVQRLNQDLERRVAERTSQLAAANADLAREIAERTQAQEHLMLLERAIEASANGIIISDPALPDNPLIFANAAFERMTGYSRDEVLGRNSRFLQGGDTQQRGVQELRAALREQRECRVVVRNFRKDGSPFWNELHLSPVRDAAGNVTHFVGVQNDITELKMVEEAVRASEERFRQLAENIREVFFVAAADSREILYVSPAYEEIWGRSVDSLYRDPLSMFADVHPDDRERVLRNLRQPLNGPGFDEYRIVRPDGTIGWVWVRVFPVRDADGDVYRVVGIAEDVTDRKQAEEELHRALSKERELNELKSRFVSMMSHEFRTPLSAIQSSTELLQHYHHKLAEERQSEHFRRIRSAVKNMTEMLEAILILGKAEAGKLEFSPETLDLEKFCRDLAEEMQLSAGGRHTIEMIARDALAEVPMDPKLLRQILTNLLSNAMKYSPQGGAVRLDVSRENGHVVFSVRDHGIGIPLEARPRLFETFHRAKNVGHIPGTGLGLAIVKRSVDLCGGTITFDSAVGSGTTFTVRLPLAHSIQEVQA